MNIQKLLFCAILTTSNIILCSEPFKNQLLRATLHGAKNGTQCSLLFTIPAVIASKDAPKERLLLLTLSGLVGATGGALFGAISALLPNKNPKDANNYWRTSLTGTIFGTAFGLTAASLYYSKDFTIFNA